MADGWWYSPTPAPRTPAPVGGPAPEPAEPDDPDADLFDPRDDRFDPRDPAAAYPMPVRRRDLRGRPEPDGEPADRGRRGLRRRDLLRGAGAVTVAGSGAGAALLHHADPASGPLRAAPSPAAPRPATPTGTASPSAAPSAPVPGLHLPADLDPGLLLGRTTYGATAATRADLAKQGATAWLTAQLRPGTLADPGGDGVAGRFPRLAWTPAQVHGAVQNGDWTVMLDLASAHLGRAIASERQLFEIMVDFWSNHLNVTCPNGDVWDTRHRYDADVIRDHALGRFEDLLIASAFHPSMLVYLNGAESTGQDPNENYGRESLELHTVSIDGGYTEADVQRAALLFTGWTVTDGVAAFDPTRHHVGPVRVLGFHHPNAHASGGPAVQRAYLRYLANHPMTARTIARKLAVRFVTDDPPDALVARLAAVYTANRTAVVPVLEALFSSPEFAASAGLKLRRPFEFVAATARALGVRFGADGQGLTQLYWMLQGMGHQPLAWPQPDGYPDVARRWQSPAAALAQFNTATSLAHGWYPDKLALPGPKGLLGAHPPRSRTAVIETVAERVLGRRPTAAEAHAARTLLAGTQLPASFAGGTYQQQETAALAATLLFSSPAHLKR